MQPEVMDIDTIRERMRSRLNDPNRGAVLCEVMRARANGESDERRLVDYLTVYLALRVEGAALKPLAADRARDVAVRVIAGLLHRPKLEDRKLVDVFLALFATTRRYYSTYEYRGGLEEHSCVGTSLLGGDYDEGVLVIDDEKIGVLWVADDP